MFPKTRDGGGVPDSRGRGCTIDVPKSQSNCRNNFVDVLRGASGRPSRYPRGLYFFWYLPYGNGMGKQ